MSERRDGPYGADAGRLPSSTEGGDPLHLTGRDAAECHTAPGRTLSCDHADADCGYCERCGATGPFAGRSTSCACVWRSKRCDRQATQEDLLCNWCGNDRTEDQLRSDPKALILPDGTFAGIGGGGPHDGTYENPGACWYPDSGRTVKP